MSTSAGDGKPLCFVLMPFGKKSDPTTGRTIDFDHIYAEGIRPAVEAAGLECIRADEEKTGGIIHKPMFERLLLCEYAVADMTMANANVFYELGVRHATRNRTTLPIFALGHQPPFDVNAVRALPYRLDARNKLTAELASTFRETLTARLRDLIAEHAKDSADSPVFQLLEGLEPPELAHLKTDIFRDQVSYARKRKEQLARARQLDQGEGLSAMGAIEAELLSGEGGLSDVEAGVLIDLYLSYRAQKGWQQMVDLFERFPVELRRQVLVREQLGFALNRLGDRARATSTLEEVIEQVGANPETNGLLGRVYKDRWNEALDAGKDIEAAGHLNHAIDTYIAGFKADWRDAYPGINACTLLSLRGRKARNGAPGDAAHLAELLPVVRFAVKQKLSSGTPDYWDHATLLELAVLGHDEEAARDHCADALAAVRESWEAGTTANNLKLVHDARTARGESDDWLDTIIRALSERAAG